MSQNGQERETSDRDVSDFVLNDRQPVWFQCLRRKKESDLEFCCCEVILCLSLILRSLWRNTVLDVVSKG